jgi:2-dehydro-3-deoxyphosphogluconate aldolase/(4S)-4-hydroxy-2-oxoglutarate aldolase
MRRAGVAGGVRGAQGATMDAGAILGGMVRRRLLAVVRTKTPEQALASAEAAIAGGITTLEIALAVPEAVRVITALASKPQVTVGAGGVLTKEQAEMALMAQARFLVCPVGEVSLIPLCREAGVVSVLGAITPSEIWSVHRAGADVVRISPVEALGGSRFLRAVLEALPPLPVMVEGGVTLENLPDFLGLPVQMIGMGASVMVPRLIARGVYAPITARARDCVLLVEKRSGMR